MLARVGVATRKAWPAIEKCLLKFSINMDFVRRSRTGDRKQG
jgi:hypothetical protein